jgi:hypothetical protein
MDFVCIAYSGKTVKKKSVSLFVIRKNCTNLLVTIHFHLTIQSRGNSTALYCFTLNLNPMVQVDISQLSGECNAWREKLRNYREQLSNDEAKLRQIAGLQLSKDHLLDVEHLHNQFHIQLINIHDLKQSIKAHDRKMNFEKMAFNGSVNEDSYTRHESLTEDYQSLEQTLNGLRNEFKQFVTRTQ